MKPESLADEGIDTVIVTSADVTGRLVGKRFPTGAFDEMVAEGVPLSSCVLGWDIEQWPGPLQKYTGHHTGWHDVRLLPDISTLRRAGWLDSTAICVADFGELGGNDLVDVAPRTVMRRQVEAMAEAGIDARMASELEFALYHGTYEQGRTDGYSTLRPTSLVRADYTIQGGDALEPFFSSVRRALDSSDLGLLTSQVEWGFGQWEINLRHGEPLETADRHSLFKLALRDLARDAGMAATFMAKPFGDTTGSSCHIHLSLVEGDGKNSFAAARPGEVSDKLRWAVAGVLRRSPELMLLYAPTVNSYRRTNSGEFSGNGLSWGMDNRMVSCRVLVDSQDSCRLEWRVPGADANPYMAYAAVIASVREGIETQADPGEPVEGEGYADPVEPLPSNLGEAVDRFRDSAFAKDTFGEAVVAHYAEAGRWEWERSNAPEAVTEWERARYFEHI